jgi:hypothetical protein
MRARTRWMDVLGQILFAAADEALGAFDFIDPGIAGLGIGHGPGLEVPHIAAGIRFGQAHGPALDPVAHLLAKEGPVFLGAEVSNQVGGPDRQSGVDRHG